MPFFYLGAIIALTTLSVSVKCNKFWHLSDTHADWQYVMNSNPIMGVCRRGPGDAGMFGDLRCYPPLLLLEESLKNMKTIESSPEFIIYGGDAYPGGDIDPTSYK